MDKPSLLTLLFSVLSLSSSVVQSSEECVNRWVIELGSDYPNRIANDLAAKYGLVNRGPVSTKSSLNHWSLFVRPEPSPFYRMHCKHLYSSFLFCLQVGKLKRFYDLELIKRPIECDSNLTKTLLSEDWVRE